MADPLVAGRRELMDRARRGVAMKLFSVTEIRTVVTRHNDTTTQRHK